MGDALTVHRLQFAFTIVYHYLFPQLTMGLALVIVVMKTLALRRGDVHHATAARFWGRIFAVTFAFGVATGIPMEFQFGTNWARFASRAGEVVGQTLALESVFAFFLESTCLGLFLFGEKRLGRLGHWAASVGLLAGTWLSGSFVVAANAFMQHPVGYRLDPDGKIRLESLWVLLTNPWLKWQYAHTMAGTVVTAATVVASVAAYYLLADRHSAQARAWLRIAVPLGLLATAVAAFPTGDRQAELVARWKPIAFAAMEGHFHTGEGASLVLIGQPDLERMRLDNPIEIPQMLSFLTHNRWNAEVRGLLDFPRSEWPDNIPLLYYAYHVMVGIGTMLLALFAASGLALVWRRRARRSLAGEDGLPVPRPLLWALLLALPLPYIANTAGWMTAELGRQPWLIHGIMRTAEGTSSRVVVGNATFSLIGFMGLYALFSVVYLSLCGREIGRGPRDDVHAVSSS